MYDKKFKAESRFSTYCSRPEITSQKFLILACNFWKGKTNKAQKTYEVISSLGIWRVILHQFILIEGIVINIKK